MPKLWLKECPKCLGDLYEEPAIGRHYVVSHYLTCLQCGYELNDAQEQDLRRERQAVAPHGARVA